MIRRNVLFVCSRNKWRSPTAEHLYRSDPRVSVRSAGLSSKSPRKLAVRDLQWADIILVMEHKHADRIRQEFRDQLSDTPMRVLAIPDDYQYLAPELLELLPDRVEPALADALPEGWDGDGLADEDA